MKNEMMAMPLVLVMIIGTALLTAVVSQAIPYVPKWWNAFIKTIKREKTQRYTLRKDVEHLKEIVLEMTKQSLEDEKRIEQLEMRVKLHENKDSVYLGKFDELEEIINNLSQNHFRRETNRKHNIRREVRDYLAELKNG